MVLDFATLSPNKIYHTLTQTIIPRPVAWVLTQHANGEYNLAPFSYFTPVCSNPPLVMFSVGYKPDGQMKDTAKNILERETFVIHIAPSDFAEKVTQTAAILDDGVSEIEANQLTLAEFDGSELPRVEGPKVTMLCKLHKHDQVGPGLQNILYGEVLKVWVDDEIVTETEDRYYINAAGIDAIGRMGGNEYTTLGQTLDVPRPK